MSDKLKESLSAVIDSEADEFELRRVLDEIGKNI
ncbi:MAG: anti-sigma factor, partial [Proteobacteria bacterium]|nr:anti-sigma factor [Pseudomonadota bacterium]